jgi:CHAD domain-containing protein
VTKKLANSERYKRFILPDQYGVDEYVTALKTNLPLGSVNESTLRYLLLDTFDWRLLRKKLQLRATKFQQSWLLELYSSRDSSLVASSPVSVLPTFITDLPDGTLANRIRDIVTPRALLPALEFQIKRLGLSQKNAETKTVLNLHIDSAKVRAANKRVWHQLAPWLELIPVKGYSQSVTSPVKIIEQQLRLHATEENPVDSALRVLNLVPAFDAAKTCPPLEPSQAALPAITQCLQHLFDVMERNEDGIIRRIDPEYLHDYRIAIRRTRTALGQLKRVFSDKFDPIRDKFAWLGELTGPARDSDVLLLELDNFHKQLPEELHSAIVPLKVFLQRKQDELYRPLIYALQSKEYKDFKTKWKRWLKRCSTPPFQNGKSALTIGPVANKRIWQIYKRVIGQGTAITPESPVSEYHELRKTCKKLRYLMEFFQSLYGKKQVRALIKELKMLQDNLGEFQDLEVQTTNLRSYEAEMRGQKHVSADVLTAIEKICAQNDKRKLQLHSEFGARFDHFSRKTNKKHFQALFHHQGAEKTPA